VKSTSEVSPWIWWLLRCAFETESSACEIVEGRSPFWRQRDGDSSAASLALTPAALNALEGLHQPPGADDVGPGQRADPRRHRVLELAAGLIGVTSTAYGGCRRGPG
jgi:hypothetical protein